MVAACLLFYHRLPFTNDHFKGILICYVAAVLVLIVGGIGQISTADRLNGWMNIFVGLAGLFFLGILLPPFNA